MKEKNLKSKIKNNIKKIVEFLLIFIISVAILLFLITIVCDVYNEIEDNSSFVCVETTPSWKIVYHKETKVMYVVSDKSKFTLLVDANGKPMIWKD